jgi:antitoxin VapB
MSFESVEIKKKSGIQIIQLPAGYAIDDDKVYLKRVGNSIYIIPFHNPWESMIKSTDMFTEDFLDQRDQPVVQNRDLFE